MTKIFFSTDVHGSEVCYRKFLNAGKYYSADILILGGDITGKMMIPLVKKTNNLYVARLMGSDEVANNEEEALALEKRIRNSGYYAYRTTIEEMNEFGKNHTLAESVLNQLIKDSISNWMELAEERLKPLGIKCYISPGNDDPYIIDPVMASANWVKVPEGRVVQLDDHHEMISTGHANQTPWSCPRDLEEESISKIIDLMASQVKNMETCIFNFHCPPFGTHIDEAPKLDENLRMKAAIGGSEMASVGSTAVRAAIEKYQPLLGLHGHIHESRGKDIIGRTIVLNPGSEYGEGILRGILIEFNEKEIVSYNFTSG